MGKERNHNFSKSGNGVTIDSSNEIYVTGRVYNRGTPQRAYVTKYDSYGNILWDKQFGSAEAQQEQKVSNYLS